MSVTKKLPVNLFRATGQHFLIILYTLNTLVQCDFMIIIFSNVVLLFLSFGCRYVHIKCKDVTWVMGMYMSIRPPKIQRRKTISHASIRRTTRPKYHASVNFDVLLLHSSARIETFHERFFSFRFGTGE